MLSITVICHNRQEYTRATLESLRANTHLPFEIIVVDNASSDGTRDYLVSEYQAGKISELRLNDENLYPGAACNIGWDLASKSSDFLVRADNDLLFKPGWDDQVVAAFGEFPKLGQLGLLNESYRYTSHQNSDIDDYVCRGRTVKLLAPFTMYKTIGGPCVVTPEMFERVRWSEKKWHGAVRNEDYDYSVRVTETGAIVRTLYDEKVIHLGFGDMQKYYGYYYKAYRERGLATFFQQLLNLEKTGKIKNKRVEY